MPCPPRRALGLLWLLSLCPAEVRAQEVSRETDRSSEQESVPTSTSKEEEPKPKRLEVAVLPAVAANTDIGVGFGLYSQFTRFLPDAPPPYAWRLQTLLQMSIKSGPDGTEFPLHDHFIDLDQPGYLNGRLRILLRAGFKKNIIAGWYGLGNASTAQRSDEPRRYQFMRAKPEASLKGRYTLGESLSLFSGLGYQYSDSSAYSGSKLDEDIMVSETGDGIPLYGTGRHSSVEVQAGIIFDNRDHENNPTRGGFHEASVWGAPGTLVGADHDFVGFNVGTTHFFPLAGPYLVFGYRVVGDVLIGRVPFHRLAHSAGLIPLGAFGGFRGVRGVPTGRYNGKVKLFGNTELRSIFYRFKILGDRFAAGASVFFDAGRLWYDFKRRPELDGPGIGLKYGVGGGPQLLWGEAVVIRADVAYSPDADPVGFYLDVGRAF